MIHPQHWSLDSIYRRLTNAHDLYEPEKLAYKPPFSLIGKTVMDIGAYIGDSAKYFHQLGAAKIICIEPVEKYVQQLKVNVAHDGVNAVILKTQFTLDLLDIPHDFCKIDVEGYEELLLGTPPNTLKPTVMEVHGRQLADKFAREGWHVMFYNRPCYDTLMMDNYEVARS